MTETPPPPPPKTVADFLKLLRDEPPFLRSKCLSLAQREGRVLRNDERLEGG